MTASADGGPSPASLALSGIQTIGNLWSMWQQNKLAKKQFKLTKDVTNTNLANQIKSYNTALFDRARGRAVMEGQTDAQRDAYIASHSLSRKPGESHKTDAYTHNYAGGAAVPPSYSGPAAGGSTTGSGYAGGISGFGQALMSRARGGSQTPVPGAGGSDARDDQLTR